MVKLKLLLLGLCATMIMGCTPQVKTVYQKVEVPIYIVPKPPAYQRPTLYIETMTDEQKNDIGELSKGYAVSIIQIKQYACYLEQIVNKYKELSEQKDVTIKPILTLNNTQDCK